MTINAAKVVARNSISLIGAELAARIVSFTVAVLLIRYLGSVELGKYSFIITYVGLFGFAIDLGVGQLVIRDVSRDKSIAPKYLGNFLLLQSILSAAMLLLLILSINLAGYPSLVKQAVYIAGLGVVIASFATPFAAMASAFEKMHFNALVAIFCATLNSLLTLAVIFLQKGLLSLVWVFLLNHLLRMMIFGWLCTRYCTRPQFGIDFSLWKYLLTSTIPFALIMILGILFNKIDVIMLSKMKGDAAVGWYSAAYKFIDVLIIIPVSINGAIFPLLSRQFVTSRDRLESTLRKSLKYQAAVGLPIAVGTTLLADKFIAILYGVEFQNSALALKILIWYIVLVAFGGTMAAVLLSMNKTWYHVFSSGMTAAIVIGLNLLFIPRYSFIATSWTTVVSGLVFSVSCWYFVRKDCRALSIFKEIKPAVVASLLMGLFVYLVQGVNLLLLILTAAIVYGISLLIFGFMGVEERQLLMTDLWPLVKRRLRGIKPLHRLWVAIYTTWYTTGMHLAVKRFLSITIRKPFSADKYAFKEDYVHTRPIEWDKNHIDYTILLETLADLSLQKGATTLDIGCNQGNMAILMAQQGYNVIGIDINPEAIEYARENAQRHNVTVKFFACSADAIPLDANSVEFACMFHLLEHIYPEDQPKSLARIRAVLKPGSKLIVAVPHGHAYDDGRAHVAFFTPKKLRKLLESNGFVVDYIDIETRGDAHIDAHDAIKALIYKPAV